MEINLADYKIPMQEQLSTESEMLGYINSRYDISKTYVCVTDIDTTYTPKLTCHCIKNGKVEIMKVNKKTFAQIPVSKGEVIRLIKVSKQPKKRKVDDKWIDIPGEQDWWIDSYEIINF
jgi:hypothetical protein